MDKNELVLALREFGLNENEAGVYLELLSLGRTIMGPIVKATRLHPQIVYGAVDRLVELRLASRSVRSNRQQVQATSPLELHRYLERKRKLANSLVPALRKLQRDEGTQPEVRMLFGREGLWETLINAIDDAAQGDKILRIIGGANDSEFGPVISEFYDQYRDYRLKNGVKKHLIAPASASTEFKNAFVGEKSAILRTIPGGISSPTYTIITPGMITLEIWNKEVLIVQICSKRFAEAYLERFKDLWKHSIPYKGADKPVLGKHRSQL